MTEHKEKDRENDRQIVRKIKNGTVIDHITAGKAIQVMEILDLFHEKDMVALLMNASSEKDENGKKDVLKVAGRSLSSSELNAISLVAPHATINIIDNYHVEQKYQVEIPEWFRGIAKCPNIQCITNHDIVETEFQVFVKEEPLRVMCTFCERIIDADSLSIHIGKRG